ncbi:MAG: hypothetical protein PVH00_09350 [Gemmatimonadota bacterium]
MPNGPRWRRIPPRVAGLIGLASGVAFHAAPARAQVDTVRANAWFAEAATLCEREGGRLWGVSLCGPMVFADAATHTLATNQPPPDADWPAILGYVNAPLEWDGTRWSTYVWSMVPAADEQVRGRLLIHELFHRVQPDLGLLAMGASNDHLDSLEGRYWLRLEWRALARALRTSDVERLDAIRDALAFRQTRRRTFDGVADSERADEIREGLAQYTGTVVAAASTEAAIADALNQLSDAEATPTFVRTFAYASGAAYGLLLDAYDPGWTRRLQPSDDLGALLSAASGVGPAADPGMAADRYGAPALRAAEVKRDEEQKARVADLRRRFVESPVLIVPRGRGAMLMTTGATPIPGEGTVFFQYRVSAEWGSLESTGILVGEDGTLRLPLPYRVDRDTLRGDGWSLSLAPGWLVRPGERAGDSRVVKQDSGQVLDLPPRPSGAPGCSGIARDVRALDLEAREARIRTPENGLRRT